MSSASTTEVFPRVFAKGAAPILLGVAVVLALMLALPGQTVVTKYVNDLLIFVDGAYRVSVGQVPNRDFHTALGPLAYYIPASGLWLTGSLGAALPVGTALMILIVAPVLAYVLDSRLSAQISLPLGIVLLLVLAVPVNLGEPVTALSFGMFYNRVGWALLSCLLIMHLPPRAGVADRPFLDASAAALLCVFLLYLKASYGVIALAFLVVTLALWRYRWAALALGGVCASAIVVELAWRSSGAHIADLILAAEVSGSIRGSLWELIRIVLNNLPDVVLFAFLTGLATWRTRSIRDLVFYGFCAAAGILIINQNFQNTGMITLYAGAAVAAHRLVSAPYGAAAWAGRGAAQLLLIAIVLPIATSAALTLAIHTTLGLKRAGEPFPLPAFDDLRLVDVWSSGDRFFSANYLNSLRNGAAALDTFVPDASEVFVLDFVSPFSSGLALQPPRGDSAWQHWGRTFNTEHVIPPEELLGGVRVVMDPKYPVERPTAEGLRRAYLPYIQTHFDFVGENVDWWIYVAKDTETSSDRDSADVQQD